MVKTIGLLLLAWGGGLLASATLVAAPETAEKSAEKEDLSAAIKKGVETLEAKKYTEFLERYMLPDDLAKFKKSGEFDKIAAAFKDHADVMIKILKGLQDLKPEMSEDGAIATFDVSKLEGPHPEKIQFRRVKDVWYIADK
jgi:hypothetical protein